MSSVTLSSLEKLTGIRAHTFRTWEQRYALLKNLRCAGGWRVYTIDQTRVLLNITLLNKAGYRISAIAKMDAVAIAEKAAALATDELQQHKAIHALFLHMRTLEPDDFEMVINSCIRYWGFDKTITDVLIPFLEKTGLLYETNNTTAENLVLNTVRHKLIAGIERLTPLPKKGDAVLLFLPEKQHHELALLYMYYLLKRQGVPALYLGKNVPLENIRQIALLRNIRAIYTCLSKKGKHESLKKLACYINENLSGTSLVFLNAANGEWIKYNAFGMAVFSSITDAHKRLPD